MDPDEDGSPGFSANMFAVLIYYFEVGDVGMGLVVGFTVVVNSTCYMTAMFFHSMSQTSAGFISARLTATFFRTGSFLDYSLFEV